MPVPMPSSKRVEASTDGVLAALADHPALGRDRQASLFDRLEWIAPLHALCMPEAPARVAHARCDDGEGWLFLADHGRGQLSAIANYYSFAARPVFAGAPAPEARSRLVEAMARTLGHDAAHVDLYPVTAEDGDRDLLVGAFRRAGWVALARAMGINHRLCLSGRDFAAYWAGRPGRLRSTVRRKMRDTPFTFSIHDTISDALWADYVDVYARSWKPDEPGLPFLKTIATQESAAGTLRLGLARRDGRAVAAQLWTVENGLALIHKLAHDVDEDAASPGTLLSYQLFRHAIDVDGVMEIDYGTGDNPYKADWMETRRTLYRVDAFNPRFMSAWLPAARAILSGVRG